MMIGSLKEVYNSLIFYFKKKKDTVVLMKKENDIMENKTTPNQVK